MKSVYRVSFKLRHDGCWTTVSEYFPRIAVLTDNVKFYPFEDKLTAIAYVSAESDARVKEFARYFEESLSLKRRVRLINKLNKGSYLLFLESNYDMSVSGLLYELQSPFWTEFVHDGIEERQAILLSKESVELLKDRLSYIGKVLSFSYDRAYIRYPLIEDIRPFYTTNQLAMLITAYRSGYFEWPRRVSLTELARELGKSKVAVSKELRYIEKKTFDVLMSSS